MKKTEPQQTETYNILFNGITDAQQLVEQVQALLSKAQQETEEIFIRNGKDKNKTDAEQIKPSNTPTLDIELTKEYIHTMLEYVLLTHNCVDSNIRDSILDKYEQEDYYDEVVEVYNQASSIYLKLGLNVYNLITSKSKNE